MNSTHQHAATIVPSASTTTAAVTKPSQRKKKKKSKSLAKLLTLPSSSAHDRLTTLHARLGLPQPRYKFIEQRRYRAVIQDEPTSAGLPKVNRSKEVVQEAWSGTSDSAEDAVWSATTRGAMEDAAREACKGLELRLVESLTVTGNSDAATSAPAGAETAVRPEGEHIARSEAMSKLQGCADGDGVEDHMQDGDGDGNADGAQQEDVDLHLSDCDFDDYGFEVDYT